MPELLKTDASPVVPTEPINDPADNPPKLNTLALPAAASPVATAAELVLVNSTLSPYNETE